MALFGKRARIPHSWFHDSPPPNPARCLPDNGRFLVGTKAQPAFEPFASAAAGGLFQRSGRALLPTKTRPKDRQLHIRPSCGPAWPQVEYPNPSRCEPVHIPALFILEYALARTLMDWDIQPAAMLGHSLGEYVAACLSGVFTLEEGLALIAERGRLLQ